MNDRRCCDNQHNELINTHKRQTTDAAQAGLGKLLCDREAFVAAQRAARFHSAANIRQITAQGNPDWTAKK